ncbi:MAG TPA: hypothetical protein EYH58_07300 [Aquifex aeolicus]|nr:hypothetical protein [Aquifex aeolicus]
MINIGKRKSGKFCAFVKKGKEKLYICTSDPEKKGDIFYVAFLIDNGIHRGAVIEGKTLKIYEIDEDKVVEKYMELPEGIENVEEFLALKFPQSVPYLLREDIRKLERRYTEKRNLYFLVILTVGFLFLFLGGSYYFYKEIKEKERKLLSKRIKFKRLSAFEKIELKRKISNEFIIKLSEIVNSLPEFQRLKSISLNYVNIPATEKQPEKLYGEMKIVIESVYPLKNSRKIGDYFVITRRIRLEGEVKLSYRNPKECIEDILLLGGELIQANPLTFKAEFKNTDKAFNFLTNIYRCRFFFKNVSMGNVHSFTLEVR